MMRTAAADLIAAHSLLVFLAQMGALLLLALVLGRLSVRMGLPSVVGELCAGVLLGPTVLNHVAPGLSGWLVPDVPSQFNLLDAVGQVGVVLLVGVTGIEVDLLLVRRRGATALRVGISGLVIPLCLGIGAAYLVPRSLVPAQADHRIFALFVGVAMGVSALPVIAKTLSDMNLLHRNVGQLTVAAGIVDDVVGWFLLSIVSAMATVGVQPGTVALSMLYVAVVIPLSVAASRPLVRWALRLAARSSEATPTIATAVVIILLSAAATQAMGMEAVFGAFVGGLLIGWSGGVDLARLAPLRTTVMAVFAPLFFATVGLRVDLTALRDPMVLLTTLAALLVAITGKFTGAFLGALASRLSRWEALALGAGMNARGVIQIVVATVGLRAGVLNTDTYTIVILVAIVTSLMAAPILRLALPRIAHTEEEERRRLDLARFRDAFVG